MGVQLALLGRLGVALLSMPQNVQPPASQLDQQARHAHQAQHAGSTAWQPGNAK
jgi:hypothetical protein